MREGRHLPSLISLRWPHEEPCAFSYPLSAQSSLGAQVILLVARKTLKLFHDRDGSTNQRTYERTNEKTKTIYPSA